MASNMRSLLRKQLQHFCNNDTLLCGGARNLKLQRNLGHDKPAIILGIESSCDDTGCGIVDSNGSILGEAISSQYLTHLNLGGIVPIVAKSMHVNNITRICEDALRAANMRLRDVDAIATTVKPGLHMSLKVGLDFGKYLAKISGKPFIPIHHMEAHALTARMVHKVEFPYLVLLVSGGHSLLALVESVTKFYLLGFNEANAPGEIFDKIARKLKLRNIPEFSKVCGGRALEIAASRATDVNQFRFEPIMPRHLGCNFNFGGIYSQCNVYTERQQKEHNIDGDMLIPDVYNLCAAVQLATVTHICERTNRVMKFIEESSLIPEEKRTLVVSGGFACNDFLAKALTIVCEDVGYNFVRTPAKLCTDNGVMIAWNGVEKWTANVDVLREPNEIELVTSHRKAPLGEDWTEKTEKKHLPYKWGKLRKQIVNTILNK